MKKYNYNFSIVTPGGCSAACDFCTDPFNDKWNKDYIKNLTDVVIKQDSISSVFNQVSVTGGEPTQSPEFEAICSLLLLDKRFGAASKFKKRVLTTNGWKLLTHLDMIGKTFDHVNISRHGIGDEENFKVFKTKNIATDEIIKQSTKILCKYGVDVNFNHVYSKDSKLTLDYISDYILYAKSLGITKVTFRYDQNEDDMNISYLEQLVIDDGYLQVEAGGCPVCREACYLIDGMYVTFKNSCAEPTDHLNDELYELIFHVDGKLYKDWGKKKPYEIIEKPIVFKNKKEFTFKSTPTDYGSGGCGSGGCG